MYAIKKRFVSLPALHTHTQKPIQMLAFLWHYAGQRQFCWLMGNYYLKLAQGSSTNKIAYKWVLKTNIIEIRKSDLLLNFMPFDLVLGKRHANIHKHIKANKTTTLYSNFTVCAVVC